MGGGETDAPLASNGYLLGQLPDENLRRDESLCMQFESVVTNSTLGFSDIVFLEINRNIALC